MHTLSASYTARAQMEAAIARLSSERLTAEESVRKEKAAAAQSRLEVPLPVAACCAGLQAVLQYSQLRTLSSFSPSSTPVRRPRLC